MDLYTKTAYQASELLTKNYSTSFSMSCRLFDKSIRPDIYAIYGLVRIADEIVDTYMGNDCLQKIDELDKETLLAIDLGYSTNLIVHSFAITAKKYGIKKSIIKPFFKSMRLDINDKYKTSDYLEYIYGSAQVVGLMCLMVFVNGDKNAYSKLESGAMALGSAYQKINFLRDVKEDYETLGRVYFPDFNPENFTLKDKHKIEADLSSDFNKASKYIKKLPDNSRFAVELSYQYYERLLKKAKKLSPERLMSQRISVNKLIKLSLYTKQLVKKVLN